MKIGICRGLDDLQAMKDAKEAGVDYFETGFSCLANFDDEKFEEGKLTLDKLGLPCLAANGFIPGNMPIVGDCVDYKALCDYLDRGFARAELLGVKKIVLGSGKARSFEEGYSIEKAKEQVAFFLREHAAPRAKKAGCVIVLEPLRFEETTMIHTVSDGVEIARMTGCDNIGGLADLYHVYGNNDSVDGIADFKGEIFHAHIAEPVKRRYPSLNDDDDIKAIYVRYLSALKEAGCDTCSVEAHTDDVSKDIKDAVALFKALNY